MNMEKLLYQNQDNFKLYEFFYSLRYMEKLLKLPFYKPEVYDILKEKINKNQVLLIEGATGSGKSIVSPVLLTKIFDYKKKILISQPRTVNIKSIAEIIALQLNKKVGRDVGYLYSGEHVEHKDNLIYVVVDFFLSRIMSNEKIDGQRQSINKFDIVIVDEIHEEGVNMDIFLAMTKLLMKQDKCPYKLVILSATVDVEKYRRYFQDVTTFDHMFVPGVAAKLEHVWIETNIDKRDLIQFEQLIIKEVKKLLDTKKGDILIFVPTTRMTLDLIKHFNEYNDIYFGSLSRDTKIKLRDYNTNKPIKTYLKDGYKRRVIFSTPIAETGLTVEGIKYVIETGLENHISYNPMLGKKFKNIQYIKKSSVTQRCGRAGRTEAGVCIHLYSKKTYENIFSDVITPAIYTDKLHDILLNIFYAVKTEDNVRMLLENLINPLSPKGLSDAINELYHLGILEDGGISKFGIAAANLGMDYDYAVLILKSYEYNVQDYMIPIVSMMLSVRDLKSYFLSKNIPHEFITTYGTPISALLLYRKIHNKILVKYNTLDEVLYSRIDNFCTKEGLKTTAVFKAIQNNKKIMKHIYRDIGNKFIFREQTYKRLKVYTAQELYKTIIYIFSNVYYKNRAVYIAKIGQYFINETESIGVPKTKFINFSMKPSLLGYQDVMYSEKPYPKKGYDIYVSHPFTIITLDELNKK